MNGVMDMLEAKEAKDNNETVIVRHYPISPILSVSCVYQTKLKLFFDKLEAKTTLVKCLLIICYRSNLAN